MKGILGKKIGMTQLYTEQNLLVPVTVIEAGPCAVLKVNEPARKGGPVSVRLGFDDKKESRANKAELGNFKKAGSRPKKFVREIRVLAAERYKKGEEIRADIFKEGEYVDIAGTSKGKGFQGGMKRWNWTAGKGGHGSMHHRRPGSIGASSFPSRVLKGQHMPGHMGSERVTVQNLKIIKIDKENNIIAVKGTIPGHNNSYLTLRSALKMPPAASEKGSKDV